MESNSACMWKDMVLQCFYGFLSKHLKVMNCLTVWVTSCKCCWNITNCRNCNLINLKTFRESFLHLLFVFADGRIKNRNYWAQHVHSSIWRHIVCLNVTFGNTMWKKLVLRSVSIIITTTPLYHTLCVFLCLNMNNSLRM